MKSITLIALVFVNSNLFGQLKEMQKAMTDSIVSAIDHKVNRTAVAFKIQALKKALHFIEYNYLVSQGKIIKIVRYFGRNSDSTEQVFYFKNNELIYSTESITSFFSDKDGRDSSYWGGTYYFKKNKLIDYITLGHGKSESDNPNAWDPMHEVLGNCQEARVDILRYKNKKKRNGG